MKLGAVLHLLCVFGVFQKGLTDLIRTQRTVMAAVGDEALLNCELMQSKDVVQVTWQKVLPEQEQTLVTYTTTYGERVNPDFSDKVEFTDAGLQSSSIIIRDVTEQDEGCYRCLFNADPEGALIGTTCLQLYDLTDQIRTQRTVMAAEGDEVHLNCELMQFKEVNKVTWWKILNKGMRNLISQHKYGQDVNPDFRDKVEFTDAGLQSSSIIIRNVTEQDEGCYRCSFNIHPGDDLKAKTCLQLYELHEPVLHVGDSNSEKTVVSCSATGRTAPTVTLTVLRDNVHFSETSSVSVSNTNGTVTVTSTAVLTHLHDMEIEVRCAVRVLSGPQKEKIMMIPEVKQSADGFSEDSGSEITADTTITILSVVLPLCCVAAVTAITVLLIRKHRNSLRQRDSEEINTPQETTEHIQGTETPFMPQDKKQLRQQTASEKSEESDCTKASTDTQRQL